MRPPSRIFDPSEPTFSARAPAVYKTLRDDYPLYEDPAGEFFALSRFEDVRRATLDVEALSSGGSIEARQMKPSLGLSDPPEHTRLRATVSRGFTARRVADLEPAVREIVRRILDRCLWSESFDAVAEIASLIPSSVFGRLLGLPDELVPVCRSLTDVSKRRTRPDQGADPAFRAYPIFADLFRQRRVEPRDDVLSALLAAELDGRKLTDDELQGFAWVLLVGGNDTTASLIGSGLELLARHPEQRAELAAAPDLIPAAVEEMLRYASPTHSLPRTAARDVETPYGYIPQGARVLLLWGAANRDEREFPDPDRFDIRRRAPRHLAFGHGIHFCIGAALARLEARIAFEEFLARVPDYTITGEPTRLVSSVFNGLETLPLAVGRA